MSTGRLLSIISSYNSEGYYKYGNIPGDKLASAAQHYPVDQQETPLALIDATPLGSAHYGMVIGLKGLYFRNDWKVGTERNFLSWEELSHSGYQVCASSISEIQLLPGCAFGMSESRVKRELLINLLTQLISLYRELSDAGQACGGFGLEDALPLRGVATASEPLDGDPGDGYAALVPELLALCIAADGVIEDIEVELAVALVDSDELLPDKPGAYESLYRNIEKLMSDKATSSALFKLKAATISARFDRIGDPLQRERLRAMVEGMLEVISDEGISEAETVLSQIIGPG